MLLRLTGKYKLAKEKLSQYYELIGDAPGALDYRHHYDKYLSKVQKQRDQNRLYITEKKYDYDRIRQTAYQEKPEKRS